MPEISEMQLYGGDYEEKGLPFSKKKQEAIIGYMLINPKFFLQARNQIDPTWFADPNVSLVYKAQTAWFNKYGRPPTVEELKHSSPVIMAEEPAVRVKLVAKVSECIHETSNFHYDALGEELTTWLRARLFYGGAYKAQKDFNKERFDAAYRVMDDTLKDIKEANFTNDREESFANWREDLDRAENEIKQGLTFGLKAVDDLLLPGNQGGSLLPGDTTILLAPTNVGKTTSMITIAGANVMRGKRVLFLTHEGRPADIKMKMRQNFMDASQKDIFDMARTDDGAHNLEVASQFLGRFLTYVPYNKAGLTVEDVEPLIRRKQEELMAKNNGKGYDLLVVDYPAKLMTKRADGGQMNKRNIDEIVYGYFIQFALEYGFHALLAIQTNREGARINKGQRGDERRLLTMEDVSESYGVMMEATNVITLNRDPIAKARKRLTYYLDKSRSSETGFAVVARTNYEHATTHKNELGCVWYRGVTTVADQVDDLLANPQKNGQEIDPLQIEGA